MLVDYVELGSAYLVRALNDEVKQSVLMNAMLKAQTSRVGRLKSCQIGSHQGKYRLMRQLESIQPADITIKTPKKDNDPDTEMLSRQANPRMIHWIA